MSTLSPCTNVCVIDPGTGWCKGCARTTDEIMRWPIASEAERVSIVAQLPARLSVRTQRKRP